MEEYNEMAPVGEGNELVPLMDTVDDVAMQIAAAVNVVNNVTTSVTETIQHIANVKLEMARLDNELEQILAQTNANLERFKSSIPMLSKQLDKASDRIDKITDEALAHAKSCSMTEDELKKHSLMIDMLESANDSFNNLLMRILSL